MANNPVQDNLGRLDVLQQIEDQLNLYLTSDEEQQRYAEFPDARGTQIRPGEEDTIPEGLSQEEDLTIRELANEFKAGDISLEELDEAARGLADNAYVRKENEETGTTGLTKLGRGFQRSYYNTRATFAGGDIPDGIAEITLFGDTEEEMGSNITNFIDFAIEREDRERNSDTRLRGPAAQGEVDREGDPDYPRGIPNELYVEMVQAREDGNDEKYQELLPEAIEEAREARQQSLKKITEANKRRLDFLDKAEDVELPAEVRLMRQAQDTDEFLEVWKEFPITAGLTMMAESSTETGLIMGSYAVANVAGSLLTRSPTIGSSAGLAASTGTAGMMEFNRSFAAQAEKHGVDLSDEESVKEFANNPELVEKIRERAAKGAGISGPVGGLQAYAATKYLGMIPGGRGTAVGEAMNLVSQFMIGSGLDYLEADVSQRMDADSEEDITPGIALSTIPANISGTVGTTAAGRGIKAGTDTLLELSGVRTNLDADVDTAVDDMNRTLEQAVNDVSQQTEEAKASVQDIMSMAPEEAIENTLAPFAQRIEAGDTQLGSLDTIADEIGRDRAQVPENLEPQVDQEVAAMEEQRRETASLISEIVDTEMSNRTMTTEQLNEVATEARNLIQETNDPELIQDMESTISEVENSISDTSDLQTLERQFAIENGATSPALYTSQKVQGMQSSMNNLSNNRNMVVGIDQDNNSAVTVNLREPVNMEATRPVSQEAEQLAGDITNRDIPLVDRLNRIQNAFEEGILTERFATDTINPELMEAIRNNDLAETTKHLRFLRPKTLNELKEAMRVGDETALSRLVGIDMDAIANGRGITGRNDRTPGSSNVWNDVPFTLDKAKRAFKKRLAQVTRSSGAQGPSARSANNIIQAHQAFLKVNKEEIQRHLKQTSDVFPDNMPQEQLDVVQDYMEAPNETTRARLNETDPTNGRWQEVLDQRAKFKDRLAAFMIDEGMAQGAFKEALVKNMGAGWHTDYAVFLGQDVFENLTPEVRRKFIGVLANKLRDPIAQSKLDKLTKQELVGIAEEYGVIEQPDVDNKGNIIRKVNGRDISEATKDDYVKALQNVEPMSDAALSTVMNRIVTRAQAISKRLINDEGYKAQEEVDVGTRQESIHKKKVLSNLDSEMANVLMEVYGRVQHPNDVFARTSMAMLKEVADYKAASDSIQFALDIGAAKIGPEEIGFSVPIANANGMSSLQSSFKVNYKDRDGRVRNEMVSPDQVFVSEELADLFRNQFPEKTKSNDFVHKFADAVVAANGLVKYSLVVANQPAIPRNYLGSIWYGTRNGYYALGDPKGIVESHKAIWQDAWSKPGKRTAMIDNLIQLGIFHDGVRDSVINDYVEDLTKGIELLSNNEGKRADSQFRKMMRKAGKRGNKVLTEVHRAIDEVTKAHGFYEERAFLVEALFPEDRTDTLPLSRILKNDKFVAGAITPEMLTEAGITPTRENMRKANKQLQSLDGVAASVTLSINPTFSKVSPFMRAMRKFPVLGPFPAFASEAYRTQFNAARYLGQLYKANATGKLGNVELTPDGTKALRNMTMRKSIGTAVEAGVLSILKTGAGMSLGSIYGAESQEELLDWAKRSGHVDGENPISAAHDMGVFLEENLSHVLPDFLQDNLHTVLDIDRDSGDIMWVDTSYMDPHGPARQMIYNTHKLFFGRDSDSTELDSKIWRVMWSGMSPILGLEPGLDKAIEAAGSRDGIGPFDKAQGTMSQIAQAVVPPFISKTNELIREGKGGQAAAYLSGLKVYEGNLFEMYRAKMAFGNMTLRENKRVHLENIYSFDSFDTETAPSYEEIKEQYIKWRSRESTFSRNLLNATESIQNFHQSDAEIKASVTQGLKTYNEGARVLDDRSINELLSGQLPRVPLQGDEVDKYVEDLKDTSEEDINGRRLEELYRVDSILQAIDAEFMAKGTIDGEEPF